MRVLVAFGSKRGGTEGLARMLAGAFGANGISAEVRSAGEMPDPSSYDAVIVGGALYMNRWFRHAARYVKRFTDALRDKPVWFFSSGPLDDSAAKQEIPPTKQVKKLMDRIGALGHMTFSGRLAADARGFVPKALPRGDWRDPEHIGRWARSIAAALRFREIEVPAELRE